MEQQKSSFSRICWYILTASILIGSYGKTTVHFSNWNHPVLATELQHVCRVVDCLAVTQQWPKLAEQHFQIGPRMGMREWIIFYFQPWHFPRNWRKSYDKITSCGDTEIEECGSPISYQNVPRKHLISCVAAALCHSLKLVQKKRNTQAGTKRAHWLAILYLVWRDALVASTSVHAGFYARGQTTLGANWYKTHGTVSWREDLLRENPWTIH